jgi:hypothetical protein
MDGITIIRVHPLALARPHNGADKIPDLGSHVLGAEAAARTRGLATELVDAV